MKMTFRLVDYAERAEARAKTLGVILDRTDLRNTGDQRTASKRALLQAVAEEAERQGRKPPFAANH